MTSRLSRTALLSVLAVGLVAVSIRAQDKIPADPIEKVPEYGSTPWTDIEARMTGDAEVIFAECYGPYVMIGRNKDPKDSRQLWNLAEQKIVANIPGKFDIGKPYSLSPDGKYFAAWRGFFAQDKVAVFDARGKPFAELKNAAKVENLQFLADGKLAAFTSDKVTIWDIPTRKAVKSFPVPKMGPFQRVKTMLSPNGKISLSVEKNVIKVFDETGKELAKYACPKVDDFFESDVIGIAFHPDGKTLAVCLNTIKKNGFCLLDVTNGLFKGPFELEERSSLHGNDDKVIDWSPDGKAILLRNRFVVDPESGKVIWSFPEQARGARPLPVPARIFAINRGIYTETSGTKFVIKGTSHDESKIAEVVKAARSGVKVTDALLPKLTETTLADARLIALPNTPVAWAGRADPAGDVSKLSKVPIGLDLKADSVDQIFFTPPSTALVFIGLKAGGGFPSRPFPGQADKSKSKGVDVYRLTDGLRHGKIDFAFAAKFRTASLDGKYVVVSDPDTGERLDILSLEKGEPVCAFRPFHQEGQNKRATYVQFVGDGKLLTGNGTRYVLWTIPACKPEVQMQVKPHVAELSANAKLLAMVENDSARVLDAGNLSVLGDLEMPNMNQIRREIKAVRFHHDGKSLAGLFHVTFKDNSTGAVVCVWDLTTGKGDASTWAPGFYGSPFGSSSIEFAGADHFLMNGTQLISRKRSEVVWNINPSHQVFHADNSPDGRHWYTARTDPFKDGASLVSADPADPKILDWVKKIEASPNAIWKPGVTVSVNVQVPNAEGDPQKRLETALTNQGIKIGAGNLTYSVSAEERATDRTVRYRDLIPNIRDGLKEQVVNIVEVHCVAELSLNGTVIWRGTNRFSNTSFGIVRLPPDENDVGSYLSKQMWKNVSGWAGVVTPPKLIVQTPEGNMTLPGTATFSGKGVEVQPPLIRIAK